MSAQISKIHIGTATLYHGDCLEVLRSMPDCSVDAVVCDPPYGLSDHATSDVIACLTAWISGEKFQPTNRGGFMGKTWDAWVPGPEVWRECLRVLKPGGHLLAFAGTRSMDLMCMAVRLAGFELRDSIGYAHDGGGAPLIAWTYGTGFPKSMDVSKAIDKASGAVREVMSAGNPVKRMIPGADQEKTGSWIKDNGREYVPTVTAPATDAPRQWEGFGTAMKPAWEPIILARKPLDGTIAQNVLAWGTGALNIDACRVDLEDDFRRYSSIGSGAVGSGGVYQGGYHGEHIISNQHPQSARHNALGRFPANLIHDGSPDVVALFPDSNGAGGSVPNVKVTGYGEGIGGTGRSEYHGGERTRVNSGSGSAARFFKQVGYDEEDRETARLIYCAKASRKDRNEGLEDPGQQIKHGATLRQVENTPTRGNAHPCVKPTDLMRYLCRLVTPPGGLVLDPFMGSGSTGKAATREGFRFIGCELDPAYFDIACARIRHAVDAAEEAASTPAPQLDLFCEAKTA